MHLQIGALAKEHPTKRRQEILRRVRENPGDDRIGQQFAMLTWMPCSVHTRMK